VSRSSAAESARFLAVQRGDQDAGEEEAIDSVAAFMSQTTLNNFFTKSSEDFGENSMVDLRLETGKVQAHDSLSLLGIAFRVSNL
jgi:hypothetical protein